jgi:hypothetical protein
LARSAGGVLFRQCFRTELPAEIQMNGTWTVTRNAVTPVHGANEHGCYAQYARAREALAEHWADEILEIADDATNDWMGRQRRDGVTEIVLNRDHVERSKQRIDARKWLLSKALPKVYGDRQSVEGKFSVDWAQVCQEAAEKYKKDEGE